MTLEGFDWHDLSNLLDKASADNLRQIRSNIDYKLIPLEAEERANKLIEWVPEVQR